MNTRRDFLKKAALSGLGPFIHVGNIALTDEAVASSDSVVIEKMDPLISFPDDPEKWPAFRKKLVTWRTASHNTLHYTGDPYSDKNFEWSQQNFSCYFLMIYDLDLYDRETGKYTVDKIVQRGLREFGGYDSIVLWHAYPRIGLDQRNQYDYYRDMPGGLAGIKSITEQFHRHGIKVFIAYCPWDKATRRESESDSELLAHILKSINGDGIFLDTMKAAGEELKQQLGFFKQQGIVLESELALDVEEISNHHASWAQWFNDKFVPGVLRNKWFEPRHMQHQIARWNDDHSTELQMAWMNGSGMMVWENVFGQWMKWSTQDRRTLKKMLPIQRRYWKLFNSHPWTPLVPTTQHGVFASEWEFEGLRLWTLVNRNQHAVSGDVLETEQRNKHLYFDLITGNEILNSDHNKIVKLHASIDARSVYCFVSGTKEKFDVGFHEWLRIHSKGEAVVEEKAREPIMHAVKPVLRKGKLDLQTMIEVQPATLLLTSFVLGREVGSYESRLPLHLLLNVPIQYDRTVYFPHLAVDITPVTNKSFDEFIRATGYRPAIGDNFLRHWTDGKYPQGKENHPVVWVDLSDARAYCTWAGKRLPKEQEWQFIAQGYDGSAYPWGGEMLPSNCNGNGNDTTPVNAYPQGKSPFGCLDMCGNTWELTESEYSDEHNRFCMLKGGSYYQPTGSIWYTPGGALPAAHSVKMLLMYPGLDRAATIGFRCVMDLI